MKAAESSPSAPSPAVDAAITHALFWLVAGNAMGTMIAVLLLLPGLNRLLGEWTYGRWMMVHMNTALYGWCSLPMLGFLFRTYGVERSALRLWGRPVVWLWSAALAVGCYSWLSGTSSGKLFLDWSGYARILFPLTMGALWLLLVFAFLGQRRNAEQARWRAAAAKLIGLAVLAAVPFALFYASSPDLYPAFNPDSGGPTGASQLESSLGMVLIVLVLPFGIARRLPGHARTLSLAWVLLAVEAAFCALLGRADASHRMPAQYIGLGSILLWLPLVPLYYRGFAWNCETRQWKQVFLCWWGLLVVSGWIFFLPGVLDRFKFTDGLVGHSLTAVAGFLTALLVFVMTQLIGDEHAWIFNSKWSFYAWNLGVLAYVMVMTAAGWIEGGNPGFTMAPGPLHHVLYFVRLLTGLAMLAASVEWWIAATQPFGRMRRYQTSHAGAIAA
jgi:cytochrome c oxidase cbb3-type subunit I